MPRIKVPLSIHQAIAKYERLINRPVKERGPSKFGWSSVSTYQICPYLFQHKARAESYFTSAGFSREVGNLVHWLMELRYESGKILSVDTWGIKQALLELNTSASVIEEGIRVFEAYQSHYGPYGENERYLRPLGVETEIMAESLKKTFRLDLYARFTDHPTLPDGVYFIDHKTVSAYTDQWMRQWAKDGQVLTGHHAALYGAIPITDYRGIIINGVGKQKKTPKFERVFCEPDPDKLAMFLEEVQLWDAQISFSLQ